MSIALTLMVAVKLAGTGIEARLAGQKGISLFASKTKTTSNDWWPVYEELPLFSIDERAGFIVDEQIFRSKLNKFSPAVVHAFECVPTLQTLDRSRLLELFRITSYVPTIYTSLYTVWTMANPSCTPNINFAVNQLTGCLALFLHDGVRAGQELGVAHISGVACMTYAERQEYFACGGEAEGFSCRCTTCTAPDPVRALSDMRRCVLRHLYFLIMGHDLPYVPVKIRGLKKDKQKSKLWRWHNDLYASISKAEKVDTLAKGLIHGYGSF
jgi:hypothetical protein